MRRLGPVERVAVLSDVHGNIPALSAVLAETADADLVVFNGDLTWGPEPERTVELVTALGDRAVFVRGNADRAVVELARGTRAPDRARDEWMPAQHSARSVEFLAGFAFSLVVTVSGLGPVRFCHGSPRSDTETVTPATPDERMAALSADIDEKVLVTGHTHLQFDRSVTGLRSINPGSVGLPYHTGSPGTAYWATLSGDGVALRQTRYDVADAVARLSLVGDPAAGTIEELLTTPPTPEELIEHAEGRVFSD